MKNPSTRTVLFCLLVAASIGSYIFLNIASAKGPSENSLGSGLKVEKYDEEVESSETRMLLPDVQLMKNLVETGKRLLPAS
ncbi:MAG: hypothetical protein H6564_18155 [Lewinellaceae bacterium]|nr:hypothetical protein [Lewinellaceae bacterium]